MLSCILISFFPLATDLCSIVPGANVLLTTAVIMAIFRIANFPYPACISAMVSIVGVVPLLTFPLHSIMVL